MIPSVLRWSTIRRFLRRTSGLRYGEGIIAMFMPTTSKNYSSFISQITESSSFFDLSECCNEMPQECSDINNISMLLPWTETRQNQRTFRTLEKSLFSDKTISIGENPYFLDVMSSSVVVTP